jgi:hypothetical protein
MTQRYMLAGAQAPGRATHARQAKGRGQTKCGPWSSRLGVERGANDSTSEKIYYYETMEEAKTHTQGCRASRKEEVYP